MTKENGDLLLSRFAANPPADDNEIAKVQQTLKFRLPESYVSFMLMRNGGEGFIGKSYLVLWKIEDLISMNVAYRVAEFAPGLFLFGSNGGDDAFGFDVRSNTCEIVSIPFVAMEIEDARAVASDFETFLSAI